jgi:NAD(P)-dependent dehydrogenase (short-subunit alcohol dehydrogenase family)
MNNYELKELFSVKDKIVMVTGAAKGNGKIIADGFVQSGAIVYYVDVLDTVKTNIEFDQSGRSKAFIIDLTEQDEIFRMINSIDVIDVLVNNAGVALPVDGSGKSENWNKTININLNAVYELSRSVCELMKKNNGGSIINITSISSFLGSAGNPSYHASKGGLKYLTKSIAADYGHYNIRVNNLCPGYIKTDMTQGSFSDEKRREIISSRTMLGRWGESSDLLGACIFLSSDASTYVTGTDILVDGGLINKGFD